MNKEPHKVEEHADFINENLDKGDRLTLIPLKDGKIKICKSNLIEIKPDKKDVTAEKR